MTAKPFHKEYKVELFERGGGYHRAYNMIFDRAEALSVDDSFTQRIVWRTWKNALVYHVVLGKDSDVIDSEDLMYGARLAAISLRDLRRVLDLFESAYPSRGASGSSSATSAAGAPTTGSGSLAPLAPLAPPPDPAAKKQAVLNIVREKLQELPADKLPATASTIRAYKKTLDTEDIKAALVELAADPALAPLITLPKDKKTR